MWEVAYYLSLIQVIQFNCIASLYEIDPILSRTSKDPQNLSTNLAWLPSFMKLFLCFTLKKTWSPTWNFICTLFLFSYCLCLSWATFRFFLILATYFSTTLSISDPSTTLFIRLSQFTRVLHLFQYNTSSGINFKYAWCREKIWFNVNNFHLWGGILILLHFLVRARFCRSTKTII